MSATAVADGAQAAPSEPMCATRCRGTVRLIYDCSRPGHRGYELPALDVAAPEVAALIPAELLRRQPPQLPEVTEPEVVRHYIDLSLLNHHVDRGFYPLGSCTMKYNPKINEELARLPGFGGIHPEAPEQHLQGVMEMLHRFSAELATIVGLQAVSLHPAAGAQGEFLGMKLFRAYHDARGQAKQTILIPDSAHGTNPASVVMCGFTPKQIPSLPSGRVDVARLAEQIGENTAGIMITNPSTLGLFENEICEIAAKIHAVDGLVYLDGANLNAFVGLATAGAMGIDCIHINLHKTFSTPHGGGGPGAGPVAVSERLAPYLPVPRVAKVGERYHWVTAAPEALGRLHPYFGNVGVILRAWAYIRTLGPEGLRAVSRAAIVNANYLMKKVDPVFPVDKREACMHEFVATLSWTRKHDVKNIDVAKRILDFGFHAPTVSFPLIVPDAFMIEPTETETRAALDAFADALTQIAAEIRETPEIVRGAPHTTYVGRLDEAAAARSLRVRYEPADEGEG
jgi:glycine dehydrogenase subunit 2